jgi:hypothetical protein
VGEMVDNTLAYYDTAKISAVKSFTVQAAGVKVIKLFLTEIQKGRFIFLSKLFLVADFRQKLEMLFCNFLSPKCQNYKTF